MKRPSKSDDPFLERRGTGQPFENEWVRETCNFNREPLTRERLTNSIRIVSRPTPPRERLTNSIRIVSRPTPPPVVPGIPVLQSLYLPLVEGSPAPPGAELGNVVIARPASSDIVQAELVEEPRSFLISHRPRGRQARQLLNVLQQEQEYLLQQEQE